MDFNTINNFEACWSQLNASVTVNLVKLGHLDERTFICHVCDSFFGSMRSLSVHKNRKHGVIHSQKKSNVCKEKKESGTRQSDKGEGKFVCKTCNAAFKNKLGLSVHSLVHSRSPQRFICKICGAERASAKHLETHLAKSCLQSRRCQECGLQLCTPQALRHHVLLHTGEKPHVCPKCSARFTYSHTLRLHMRCHNNVRPYSCNLCGATFRQRPHMATHKRVFHEGLKPYACKLCGKTFGQSSHRNTHMKTHGEKKCVCTVCGAKFHLELTLKLHMRRHTGEKPYACSECPEKFAQLISLKHHREKHLGGVFRCAVCGHQYSTPSALRSHIQRQHKQ